MYYRSSNVQAAVTVLFSFVCIIYLVADLSRLPPSLLDNVKVQGQGDEAINSTDRGIPESHLHLLIPATSNNKYLCQLLLSASVLGYPVPTLINWGARENSNAFVQHLAKVKKILDYLKTFPPGSEDDLVLIVDGYDVWFQLRPDVLIRRYFAVKQAADNRVALELGLNVTKEHDIRHTVIFGPDKLCWPSGEGRRPACWAVPQSPLPANSFGPFDDTEVVLAAKNAFQARARWLNSGTIMGTLADVRAVFEATSTMIHAKHTTDSDQYYMANLFGEQEYARKLLKPEPKLPPAGSVDIPSIKQGKRSEFHIGLDYESALFQNLGYYVKWIAWLWFDGSNGPKKRVGGKPPKDLHGFVLPNDIEASPSPFSAEKRGYWVAGSGDNETEVRNITSNLPLNLSWQDMPLATNVITKQTFVLMHFTFEKKLRDIWWDKMWFYPYGRQLLQASIRVPRGPLFDTAIDGRLWWKAEASHLADSNQLRESTKGMSGGAWSDKGMWVPWNEMCLVHEEAVFGPN